MRLVYTDEAVNDLLRLREFIKQRNPEAAQRVGLELVSRVEKLLVFPEMGKKVEHAPNPEVIRDLAFGKYVVRYALHGGVVAILRIWHHYEDRGADS